MTLPSTSAPRSGRPPTLHHVGFVVPSISAAAARISQPVGASWTGEIIDDPLQQVRVAFLQPAAPDDRPIELIEPAGEASPVSAFLAHGGGFHHVCFEVDSLDEQLAAARGMHAMIVRKPVPAVAFGGRRIAWVYTVDRLLVEYLER